MKKTPTIFQRDRDTHKVIPELTPGCEWVLAGEGKATRKLDGTCVMIDEAGFWWARRELKPGKPQPEGQFIVVEHDEVTHKTVGWVPITPEYAFDKYFMEAVNHYLDDHPDRGLPEAGTYELIGPKINGNPEQVYAHTLVRHADAPVFDMSHIFPVDGVDDAYAVLKNWLTNRGFAYEGIVWHHPDGRMAKLKARDFLWI